MTKGSSCGLHGNVRLKKGYSNTALYNFDTGKLYLVNNVVGDMLLTCPADIDEHLLILLEKYGLITFAENEKANDPTFFDYYLFSDAYSYKKCSMVYLEVSNACNFHCDHCYAEIDSNSFGFMAPERARKYIQQIAESNSCDIRITGGEPFINKDIMEILGIVSGNVQPVSTHSIATNGSFTYEQALEALKLGFELQVSIYGMTAESFSAFTKIGKVCFEELFRKLEMLSSTEYADKIVLAFAVNKITYPEIKLFLDYSSSHGFRYLLNRTASLGRAKHNLEPLRLSEADEYDFARLNGRPIPSYCYHLCQLHWVNIKVNGDVAPCPYFRTSEYLMGNLEDNDFSDIWKCEKYNRFRAMTPSDVANCCDCEFEYLCSAGCCGETKSYSGNILDTYPWCKAKPYINRNYLILSNLQVAEVTKLSAGVFEFNVFEGE